MSSAEVAQVLTDLYRSVVAADAAGLRAVLHPDVFVMTPAAGGVHLRSDDVVADLMRWAGGDAGLDVLVDSSVSGVSPSGTAAWVFDRLTVTGRQGTSACSTEVRVTSVLTHDGRWRVAAAYWSIPYATQQEQDEVKHAGALEPGVELPESLPGGVGPIADALAEALADPQVLPDLYASVDNDATIGSVGSEVFLGGAGKAAWAEFVQYVKAFKIRGPMCGAVVAPDLAWLAANIDIGTPPTPYRFFYVWLATADGWRIVVSHDAVSRDPRPG